MSASRDAPVIQQRRGSATSVARHIAGRWARVQLDLPFDLPYDATHDRGPSSVAPGKSAEQRPPNT
ncbi:MAG: hypothetical protein ACRD1T_14875, partial [Acidimicrobiia bacterium]